MKDLIILIQLILVMVYITIIGCSILYLLYKFVSYLPIAKCKCGKRIRFKDEDESMSDPGIGGLTAFVCSRCKQRYKGYSDLIGKHPVLRAMDGRDPFKLEDWEIERYREFKNLSLDDVKNRTQECREQNYK